MKGRFDVLRDIVLGLSSRSGCVISIISLDVN